jgi:hypothetical protein
MTKKKKNFNPIYKLFKLLRLFPIGIEIWAIVLKNINESKRRQILRIFTYLKFHIQKSTVDRRPR